MQVVNISEDLLAKILVSLPKGTPIFESFLKIAGSVQNASNGLNGGFYSCGNVCMQMSKTMIFTYQKTLTV